MSKRLYAKYVNPSAGHDYDIEKCKKLLKLKKYYEVDRVEMGGYHTDIYLKEFENISFNSVNFKFYIKKGIMFIPHDIYSDPEYNSYMD